MTDIERVRELCKTKGVPVSALEKFLNRAFRLTGSTWNKPFIYTRNLIQRYPFECQSRFSGYLNPKKAKTISYARLMQIAAYFNVPISDLIMDVNLSGDAETKKAPTPEGERESGFAYEVTQFLLTLPKDRLRGILLALGAPEELLSELDRQE